MKADNRNTEGAKEAQKSQKRLKAFELKASI
jgi:hypothetical protein